MANELSIPTVLSLARVCEYLNAVRTNFNNIFKGGDISEDRARLIYMERTAVQNRYNLNPSDPTLPGTANYLFSILRYQSDAQRTLNNVAAGLAVVTGPSNQSVNVGQSATFTFTVTSSTSYTIAWYRNGVLIPGQTGLSYTLTNAQLTDTGALFSAIVTNAAGPISSNTATLTVTAALVGSYYQGTTDYSALLLAGSDTVPYLGTFPITTGQPFTVTFPNLVSTQYIVVKYPATEPTKTSFLNPPPSGPDTGPIPNIALEVTTIGAWKYVFSRTGNTFGLNSVNGKVQFS
jgi:hypothetical protein